MTVLLMLDQGRLAAAITLGSGSGLDASIMYRYAQTYRLKGVAGLTGRRAAQLLGLAE